MLLHKVLLYGTFLEELKDGILDFFRNCLILNCSVDIHIDVLYYHQRKNSGDFH